MKCPECGNEHTENENTISIMWKGEPLQYEEKYLICNHKKVYTENQLSENWRRLIRAERIRDN